LIFVCRCTAFSYLEGDPELAFFAIYDGHGGTGKNSLDPKTGNIAYRK